MAEITRSMPSPNERTPYEATTGAIRIRVEPRFDEERSDPVERYYFWSYTIEIANLGSETVQLIAREWRITDMNGLTEVVRGPGVVGEQPVLAAGERFTYTSGCPLRTPSGIMVGSYEMQTAAGLALRVGIPAFSLDSPYATPRMN